MIWNRNKRSVAIDLKTGARGGSWRWWIGRIFVVENFRPGVLDRLGLGWEVLHARNPRLIMGSISGFGQTGPYARARRLRPDHARRCPG